MSSRSKYIIIGLLIGLILFLSGCSSLDEPITAESTGFWSKYFVYPMSQLITFFAELVSNYGLAIVIVTLIIRLLLLPLNVKQIRSSIAMQKIQPELQELQKKYSSKDANTQQKLQQETMALFQKHGANPLAGCLPILVQMPILIAMYQAIMRTEAIKQGSFLWLQLGSPDPIYILPIIVGGATFLQQRLMMADMQQGQQNPQMQMMMYMMPIMLTVITFILPSALGLYWVVGNLFMVAQTIFVRKPMMEQAKTGGEK
ncbi:MAG TPA: membrane protein insertase YidC [Bacillota bacterium]|nr:membrane protein insertase YidC [Bacillota bacterium]